MGNRIAGRHAARLTSGTPSRTLLRIPEVDITLDVY